MFKQALAALSLSIVVLSGSAHAETAHTCNVNLDILSSGAKASLTITPVAGKANEMTGVFEVTGDERDELGTSTFETGPASELGEELQGATNVDFKTVDHADLYGFQKSVDGYAMALILLKDAKGNDLGGIGIFGGLALKCE